MPTYLAPGVYVEEVSSGSKPIEGVGTSVCAFVGFAEKGPLNEPTLVTNWSQFAQAFGDFISGSYLAHAVYGYFLNGGGTAYVVRIGSDEQRETPPPRAEIPAVDGDGKTAFTVRALAAGNGADQLAVEVTESSEPGEDAFKLLVKRGGEVVETFDNVTLKRGSNNVTSAVKQRSKLIAVEDVKQQGGALALPARGTLVPLVGTVAEQTRAVEPSDYVGTSADRTGFAGLEAVDEITMLCVPDLMTSYQQGGIDLEGVKAVQLAMIAHCELMSDRLAVLDTPPGLNVQQVRDWRMNVAGYDSKFAAMYWPWVKVMDTVTGKPVFVPPSGHIAGIWARNDATRGVHKAPANEVVRGAIALELGISRVEQEQLNPVAVNCLRSFPGQGIRVWGARTLSSDPEWRYVNVRRLFNYVEQSILQGTNWVVFEPNDPKLWDSVKRTITMFLRGVWRDGALYGRTPGDSFFVKCDEENNPPESRDAGMLTVEVGIAPVKPAEFVVFRISQYSDGSALEE